MSAINPCGDCHAYFNYLWRDNHNYNSLRHNMSFPVPVNALIGTINAILDEDTLPIDKSRIAIGGFRADTNLAGSLPDENIQRRIDGVVSYYLPGNFLSAEEGKPNDSNGQQMAGSALPHDHLTMFSWGYA